MAVTKGQGNPHWTRDEVILALELFQECAGKIPSPRDPRVMRLSKLLRSMPHAPDAKENDRFRNADGVGFKLQNIRKVATGKGLGNVSQTDRRVVEELGNKPAEVKRLADLIRSSLSQPEGVQDGDDVDEDEEFFEGTVLTSQHKRRERKPALRKRLLSARRKSGSPLTCDMCGSESNAAEAKFADSVFEAHHTVPVAMAGQRATRIADLSLLCANCHRLLHRGIAASRRWLSIDEAKRLLSSFGH